MPPLQDLTGRTFGRLTVLGRGPNQGNRGTWLCRCACGEAVRVLGASLRAGRTRSCGCLHRDAVTRHGQAGRHGDPLSRSITYISWLSMIQRCTNPRATGYEYYGGRGVTVCERWRKSFADFLADVGERPGLGYSLDRIDPAGHYEPGNCRWTPKARQGRNRRDVGLHEAAGTRL